MSLIINEFAHEIPLNKYFCAAKGVLGIHSSDANIMIDNIVIIVNASLFSLIWFSPLGQLCSI